MKRILLVSIVTFIGLYSCKKDIQFTKDHLAFSTDTLLFDTVFTTVGSTTKRLKIYNYNNQPLNIEAIQLMGGDNSPFRINVDGVSADYLENVVIPANDSLFIFVEVTLQVNNQTNPLVISDSIRFLTNGLNQYVNLDVWGQDAYFHNDELVEGIWPNDKPHVLYNVVACGYPGLDSNKTLTIQQGTQIYCHKNSTLIVYKSAIDIQGTLGNEVVFQGDRLESFYDEVSGQWWGIRLIETNTCNINYAIIKNGSVGLQVDSTQAAVTLVMNNTIIDNHDFFALNVNAGANVQASNCFLGDAGLLGTFLFAGGEYHFTNCNFVNYWPGSRGGPALLIQNYWEVEGNTYCRPIINSEFNSNIAYGTIDKEFEVDTMDCGVSINFNKNFWKRDEAYAYSGYPAGHIWTGNPFFVDVGMNDFHVANGSPLIDAGSTTSGEFTSISIDGVISQGGARDIGCYEYEP